jgi:hypothetical protein
VAVWDGCTSRKVFGHFVQESLPLFAGQELEKARDGLEKHRGVSIVQRAFSFATLTGISPGKWNTNEAKNAIAKPIRNPAHTNLYFGAL